MIPVQGFQGARVAVLGLGRSGLATAYALEEGGATALCWDDNAAARDKAEQLGLEVVDLTRSGAFDDVACLVVSPGIPHLYPEPHEVVQRAQEAGVLIDNDVGLFFRSFATSAWDHFDAAPRVVAITGSNGKSTTSALVHHIMQACGRNAQLGGNIGTGVLSLEPAADGDVIVLELSSYQTELARALTPDIAVLTNISPDHLERHGGLGGYFAAKRRLFAEGGPDRAIVGVDEHEGQFLAAQLAEGSGDDRVIRVSSARKIGHGWSVVARKGFLSETRKGRQVASIDLRDMDGLPGAHNHQNACAAYAVARALGFGPRPIEKALRSFSGLPHRSQFLGEKNGVRFVNDSKATNVQSAAMALAAFKKVRWIAGGQGKEGGISALVPNLGCVSKAYLIGASAQDFAQQMGAVDHEICGDLETAFARATADATANEVVLLAPAAASFDQFADFEARGDAFVLLVEAHLAS